MLAHGLKDIIVVSAHPRGDIRVALEQMREEFVAERRAA
jgi:hypothetical protein